MASDEKRPSDGFHVEKRKEGRVKPTPHRDDVSINDDAGLEHEADLMGEAALRQAAPPPLIVGDCKGKALKGG